MQTSTTAGRLLSLLSLLQARHEWPGGELQDRLEVSARTVRRDVERLRDLGYPIDSVSGPAGGYKLRAGAAMPPLLLDDEEAVAVAIGLRTAARSAVSGIEETALRALVKLEQVLPPQLRRRVGALSAATSTPGFAGGITVDAQALTALAIACRDCEMVRFDYSGRDRERSRRQVEPHALVTLGSRWYLVAFDPDRGAWRTFRVDRVSAPRPAGRRFKARVIPGRDPAAFVRGAISKLTYRYEAVVTYQAPVEDLRPRLARGWGRLEALDECTCRYHTSDDDLDWLAFRIGMAGADFTVDGSPELRAALARLAHRFSVAAAEAPE